MEMRLRAPVIRGYFFLLGALRLVNAASPGNIDEKKISSGTQGTKPSAIFVKPRKLRKCSKNVNFGQVLENLRKFPG